MVSKEGKILREIIFGEKTSRKAYFCGEDIIVVLLVIRISIMSLKILTENITGN